MIVVSLLGFLIVYMLRARRNRDAAHREFVNRNKDLLRATVRPNTGAVWFNIEEIKAATDNLFCFIIKKTIILLIKVTLRNITRSPPYWAVESLLAQQNKCRLEKQPNIGEML